MTDENKDTYLVTDCETTIRCPIGSNKASPFWKNVTNPNYVVYEARKRGDCKDGAVYGYTDGIVSKDCSPNSSLDSKYINNIKLLVGHNLPFDVHHMLPRAPYNEYVNSNLHKISWWDTQLAEYLLSAQQNQYPSLDYVSTKYGLPIKDDKIKQYWADGVDTPDIPEAEIVPYALQDVMNTEQVFLKQYVEIKNKGMLALAKSQMAALKTTTFMSYNGMYINKDVLWKDKEELKQEAKDIEFGLLYVISTTDYPECDYNSNKQLATLLFGGTVKYTENELVGKFKNGKDKYQKVTKEKTVKGCSYICTTTSPAGNRTVDDEVLQYLIETYPMAHASTDSIPYMVLQLRALNKQISTYYEGIEALIMPDGLIHQQLNHVVTKTGRLSCTQPNLQNITNGNIKKVFTSRFGAEGVIIDIDFSQLEIVALAYLTQDVQLCKDITSGIDIHTALYKSMYGGMVPTPEQRKAFKRLAFGLIYGAGSKSLAKNAGVTETTAKAFISAFFNRYPGVAAWRDVMQETIKANRTSSDLKDEDGFPIGVSLWKAVTGRELLFKEYKLSEQARKWKKGKTHDFSFTEACNYPIQSIATGDIVLHALGMLGKLIIGNPVFNDRCLMVNSVHDSCMFDCRKDALDECLPLICKELNKLKDDFDRTFNLEFGLPIRYNVSVGSSWFDVKELSREEVGELGN